MNISHELTSSLLFQPPESVCTGSYGKTLWVSTGLNLLFDIEKVKQNF